MEELITKLEQILRKEKLWVKDDRLIVGVSGGPDSMALLNLLSRMHVHLIVAHVNHGFRQESEQEQKQVKSYCEQLRLPFETISLNLAYIKHNKQGIAREKRLSFFENVAQRYGAKKVVLAHHQNDQAETLLMKLLRGAGIQGMKGIETLQSYRTIQLLRPLLTITKQELIDYCHQKKIPYVQDQSNLDSTYFRNQVRLELLPYLKQFQPNLEEKLAQSADILNHENRYFMMLTEEWFQKYVDQRNKCFSFEEEFFLELPIALQRRVIKLILSYLITRCNEEEWITYLQIEHIRKLIDDKKSSFWYHNPQKYVHVYRAHKKIIFSSDQPQKVCYRYICDSPFIEKLTVDQISAHFTFQIISLEEAKGLLEQPRSYRGLFDLSALIFPLTIRNLEPGDRIHLLGLNRTKKVYDILSDEKVPKFQRTLQPVVENEEGILWVPGMRRSISALVTSDSKQILQIEFQRRV